MEVKGIIYDYRIKMAAEETAHAQSLLPVHTTQLLENNHWINEDDITRLSLNKENESLCDSYHM